MIANSPTRALVGPPPLESGDRLSRPEFERRYAASPHVKKAELIEGVVYVASPLRFVPHAEPHGNLVAWLGVYKAMTPGLRMGIEPTVRLDFDNEPQPDAVLFLDESVGGQVPLTADGYLEGPPELAVEVAASSVAIYTCSKKQAYRRNGVLEYIIWQSYENKLDWWVLTDGDYVLLQPDGNGILKSSKFPGLWLSVDDLLSGNMAYVLEILQQGIRSPEHLSFVEKLAA